MCTRFACDTTCLPSQKRLLTSDTFLLSLSLLQFYSEVLFKMVELTISAAPKYSARGLPLTIDVTPQATVGDVKAAVAANFSKVNTCC